MASKVVRGDVWIVDLGMVAEIRPCLVLSIPCDDENDSVLTTLVPHTTRPPISKLRYRYAKSRSA